MMNIVKNLLTTTLIKNINIAQIYEKLIIEEI
jgi:hypothetical protein